MSATAIPAEEQVPATAPRPSRSEAPVPGRWERVRDILWIWAFCGLAAGVWNVSKLLIKQYGLNRFTWAGRDFLWMSPLGNLLLLAVPATILFVLLAISPRLVPRWLAAFFLAVLAALGMVRIVPGLAEYAIAILSVGLAVQLGRMLSGARGELWMRVMRWCTVSLAVLVVGAGGGSRLWRMTNEWRWSQSAAAAPEGAPNVLFLLLDTVRAQSMSLYTSARNTTPTLDSLARDATVFNYAFSSGGWTLPAHCSFFTGRNPADHSCRWEVPFTRQPRTIAEVLQANGYRTGGFVANHFYTTHETGLAQGFSTWEDFKVTFTQILASASLAQSGIVRDLLWGDPEDRWRGLKAFAIKGDPKPFNDRKIGSEVNDEFLDWADNDGSRPFFAYLNYFDAHDPYLPPEGYGTRFTTDSTDVDLYDGGIAYVDEQIRRLLSSLRERGLLENTVVIVASDHGEQFGERYIWTHGNSLYSQLLHVPLLVWAPGRAPAGVRVDRAVSLRDLPRTILELAGIADTNGIYGTSLVPVMQDSSAPVSPVVAESEETPKWKVVPTGKGALVSLIDDRYHYIRTAGGREELYAYRDDRMEFHDLARDSANAALVQSFRERLREVRRAVPPANADSP